jgi:hypothetical protein
MIYVILVLTVYDNLYSIYEVLISPVTIITKQLLSKSLYDTVKARWSDVVVHHLPENSSGN